MNILTSRFGEIEVPDESLIEFPRGIIGFRDARRFVIFDCGEQGIFKWLQSADIPDLAFVICEAHLLVPEYKITLRPEESEILKLTNSEDAAVCLILVIPENPQEATANLLGPIVMNSASRLGMQLVLINADYSTRYKIFAGRTLPGAAGKEGDNVSA
ncbi:MAG: flagellar assembly protein FliW [Planctomycetota bacterium]|nr:flagellar assembly protein FliW [Planctomycetota bacterium]